jgi:hypothetical protein
LQNENTSLMIWSCQSKKQKTLRRQGERIARERNPCLLVVSKKSLLAILTSFELGIPSMPAERHMGPMTIIAMDGAACVRRREIRTDEKTPAAFKNATKKVHADCSRQTLTPRRGTRANVTTRPTGPLTTAVLDRGCVLLRGRPPEPSHLCVGQYCNAAARAGKHDVLKLCLGPTVRACVGGGR